MENSTKRLYQAVEKLKGLKTQAQIARAFNTSSQVIKNWENRGISKDGLLKAQEIFGISACWLETGEGEMILPLKKIESNTEFLGYIDSWEAETKLAELEVKVPFYEKIKLSSQGFSDDIKNINKQEYRFPKEVLDRCNIHKDNVVCVKAIGDSMIPMFSDGAILAIDMNSKEIRDGKIYAFNHKGAFRTRILQCLPDNKLRIKSYNTKDYPDEEASLNDIFVIGRVFWKSEIIF